MKTLLKLGSTVVGTIVKIASNNDKIGSVVDGMFQFSEILEDDWFTQRDIDRTSSDITDKIARSCNQILNYHDIPNERAEVFYEKLIDTVNSVDLSYELIISKRASADVISKMMKKLLNSIKKNSTS